jgi:hypothetical protein
VLLIEVPHQRQVADRPADEGKQNDPRHPGR